MIDAVACTFAGDLVVFPQHRRQLQLLEVMAKQDLRRTAGRARRHRVNCSLAAHAALPGMRMA